MRYFRFVIRDEDYHTYRSSSPARFTIFAETLGTTEDRIYDLEELQKLKSTISKTSFKRLQSLSEGKYLYLSKSSRGSSFGLLRLTDEQVEIEQRIKENDKELKEIKDEIERLTPQHLLDGKKECEKEQRKLKKQLDNAREAYTKEKYW